jgi:hypothetical protein
MRVEVAKPTTDLIICPPPLGKTLDMVEPGDTYAALGGHHAGAREEAAQRLEDLLTRLVVVTFQQRFVEHCCGARRNNSASCGDLRRLRRAVASLDKREVGGYPGRLLPDLGPCVVARSPRSTNRVNTLQ